ncbi:4-hydroxy-3-methylbut-2-enyl diphosphate reductase [Photobacterium iliopiscarium]|jgi:4-hydroxy-3-methylbut-2-enyl diphosphate reductase|uniref:4-hydroxy-3-methylbut-2-enyl diphosphate reductase n=1 Tax=Photobacterium iliopiscarium TaxID=56192 RepID=A0A0D8Q1N7_9GAMM|nr:4-hydroxy-3-methylbut-2-enyl diphosphate reductase [Photobacterium iliopiscarium]KJG14416.1 4-hydroxy-3-methylbut-2-enyl diphosphate reductase [Photobacterium iliopiscarium]KJG25071.1 4-hydroxy-3-methylbut-2-enyl diphosphate reductase [Photobacterium iliopiscarium]PST99407.1 4-hydroxy-3-methylbut-2-enyl diphosphate reductase [Photobacterium iliopiscarium]PSV82588.1 4-hydroxy-3-methylbut-2-enyl diphosphate reductase [Photobacterium iliopiscarium]PSV97555.1 4-hydroxy-3-methylbut-2-enyl diphos
MKILLANPRGFCAGVDRAISIVERALEMYQPPIYVRHEVVHNRFVVEGLKQRGAVFVEHLSEVPDDNIVIFSAHGVSQAVRNEAKARQLTVFDATCPLVTKVHMEVARASRKAMEVVLIGHAGHPEVEGTMGQYANHDGGMYLVEKPEDVDMLVVKDPSNLHFVSQTTLSVDETADVIDRLRHVFPDIQGPRKDDICYATQNRQDAVREMAAMVDVMIVVGSKNSSNSNRLSELAVKLGTSSYLTDSAEDIDPLWFEDKATVGITAGASAPEELVNQIITRIKQLTNATDVEELSGREENMFFEVPRELQVRNI